jgi:hypothetical protein
MNRLISSALVTCVFGMAAASPALAQDWRFCVGIAPATHEAVITDVFGSSAESAALEHRFETYFRAKKGRTLTFQCPRGAAERVDALNAQTAALQFNRRMGFSVSGLSAAEIPGIVGADM